jgi:hypothetical protein
MKQIQDPKPTLKLNKQVVAVLDQAELMAIKGGQLPMPVLSDVCTGRTGTFIPLSYYRDEESI